MLFNLQVVFNNLNLSQHIKCMIYIAAAATADSWIKGIGNFVVDIGPSTKLLKFLSIAFYINLQK